MTNKVVNRFPQICAAGSNTVGDGLTSELKDYTNNEVAEHFIEKNKLDKKIEKVIDDGVLPKIPPNPNTETTKLLIEANLNKFRFQEFEENFYEDLYYLSAKQGRIGTPARIRSKPDYVTNTSRIFGKVIETNGPAYEIVLPKKTPAEILKEQQVFHDKYVLSHKSYFPSEQVQRYSKEIFDPTGKTFGRWDNVDVSGKQVKNCLHDCSIEETVILNTIQEDVCRKRDFKLGKAVRKQDFNHPEGLRFGSDSIQDTYNLSCLIQNTSPCPKLKLLQEGLSYLSCIRNKIKNSIGFNLAAVEINLLDFDKEKTFRLDWKVIFQIFAKFQLYLDHDKVILVANHFKIVEETGKVKYLEFLNFLRSGIPLPKLKNLPNLNPVNPELYTTYREFATDIKRNETCKFIPTAGILHKEKPQTPKGNSCRADLESLGDETDVKACISPSIACQYGLSHRDYLLPRSKDEIRRIFNKCLKNIDNEQFDKLYDEALHLHTSLGDKASVEAFKCCLVKYRKIQAIKIITL